MIGFFVGEVSFCGFAELSTLLGNEKTVMGGAWDPVTRLDIDKLEDCSSLDATVANETGSIVLLFNVVTIGSVLPWAELCAVKGMPISEFKGLVPINFLFGLRGEEKPLFSIGISVRWF